jgi:uncharacterized protein YkwD
MVHWSRNGVRPDRRNSALLVRGQIAPGRRRQSFVLVVLGTLAIWTAALAAGRTGQESLRHQALALVNQARQQEGLPSLRLDASASAAAQAHAEDMLRQGYYSHTSPSGETVRDRYIKSGGNGSRLAAENIARCQGCLPPPITASVDALHEGWMQSPLHRDNILRRGVSEFGFGIAVDATRGLYAVQVFAGAGLPRDLQPGEPATPLGTEAQLAAALDQINRLRREAGRAPIEPHATLATAAQALLPEPRAERLNLAGRDIYAALPEGERRQWRALAVLGAACGGCSEAPTAADIRDFAQQWRNDERHGATLLGSEATHLGFALIANGDGGKLAVAVFGTRR